jgi:HD superfamily phosphohydrolase
MDRLKRISQDDLDGGFWEKTTSKNRFDHAIGTSYLTTNINCNEKEGLSLRYAALLHDIGTPCFGHLGEDISNKLGIYYNHEKENAKIVSSPPIIDSLNDIGIMKEVVKILEKKHYLSPLIFNSIDLDNIDNCFIYWSSKGNKVYYDPIELSSSFYVENKKVYFDSSNLSLIEGWKNTRSELYSDFINDDYRVRKGMLGYALYLTAKENKDIFTMENTQAIELMNDNEESKKILNDLLNDRLYSPSFSTELFNVSKDEVEREYEEKYLDDFVFTILLELDRRIILNVPNGEIILPRKKENVLTVDVLPLQFKRNQALSLI